MEELEVDFIVLVCYMQIFFDSFVVIFFNCIINIYYFFLFVFKGVCLYYFVFERGVKIIGVISYYVIVDLDEGLIIF